MRTPLPLALPLALSRTAVAASIIGSTTFFLQSARATPYPHPRELSSIRLAPGAVATSNQPTPLDQARGREVLRIQIDWQPDETYRLSELVLEPSGTSALLNRMRKVGDHRFGSYHATLLDPATRRVLDRDSIGTGKEFRKLTRALSFRFAVPKTEVLLQLEAEAPVTGERQQVLLTRLLPQDFKRLSLRSDLDVTLLRPAQVEPALVLAIFSEGYTRASQKARFLKSAREVVATLERSRFPMQEHLDVRAVFGTSREALGAARDLGLPVRERDSFLGLYYPYWNPFERWYHVLYPTRESRFRGAIGQVAYDYAFVLVDRSDYWGVGNFKELTAIPAHSQHFSYLLLHEFGHFFGLNEEYESGGRTELEFAPLIPEPWSPNITFQPDAATLKWKPFVSTNTPVPTGDHFWRANPPVYGAYRGGYAQSSSIAPSHKPGHSCIMKNGGQFCAVCRAGITDVIRRDLGLD